MLIDEFSFASPEYSLPRILAIRAIELASGQPRLKRLYRGYQAENLPHSAFWNEAVRLLNLDMRLYGSGFDKIPETGPLVVVANPPYGVLDGIAICWLVAQKRQDFKILINNVLCRAPEIEPHVLPVDFTESPEALATNLSARKQAREILDAGGTVIVFPAGGISTTGRFWARTAEDDPWAPLVGQLVRRSKATVLPVFFDGQNSLAFQMASHVSYALRVALIFREVCRRIGTPLDMVVGEPLDFAQMEAHLPPKTLAAFLQTHTHDLRRFITGGAD